MRKPRAIIRRMSAPAQPADPAEPAALPPLPALREGSAVQVQPGEAAYEEVAWLGRAGHDIAWQHERAVPLCPDVWRLTAPNPGFMTGPGTNSYLIGPSGGALVVIDPGPADPAHVQRLWHTAQELGGRIAAIVCTHSHPDHAPGAWLLQALCPQRPPVLGLPSQPGARADSHFRPDRPLADGQALPLGALALHAIHTPGHTGNHLCLLLPERAALLTGDHVLGGSSTVIDAPDGDMSAYLHSLDKLDALCAAHAVCALLPAHGHVLLGARGHLARIKAHRLAREARVRAAMQALPRGSLDDWLPLAYADVPPSAWPAARKSLLAHVLRLRQEGDQGQVIHK